MNTSSGVCMRCGCLSVSDGWIDVDAFTCAHVCPTVCVDRRRCRRGPRLPCSLWDSLSVVFSVSWATSPAPPQLAFLLPFFLSLSFLLFTFSFFFGFKTRFLLCVASVVLELALWTRSVSNSQRSALPLPPECWEERCGPPLPSVSLF